MGLHMWHMNDLRCKRSKSFRNRSVDTDSFQVETLQDWLDSIKMGQYVAIFQDAGYTELHEVSRLEKDDLYRIGITLIGHRNKIIKSIKGMQLHFNNMAYEAYWAVYPNEMNLSSNRRLSRCSYSAKVHHWKEQTKFSKCTNFQSYRPKYREVPWFWKLCFL